MIEKAAWRSIRAASKAITARDLDLQVEGAEHVPDRGPVILAARHYHHLYDGSAIMAVLPRQVQVLVGLDWIERGLTLTCMQAACRSAGWPVVFRNSDSMDRAVWLPALRRALDDSREILRKGNILLVFPEAYPTVDPHGSPKQNRDEFLPFHPGFARIAIDAWQQKIPVEVVPVGFHYEKVKKWTVKMRIGVPVTEGATTSARRLSALIEHRVVDLSS